MIPERTEQGKYAKTVFYHHVNDIDIYVEDTARGSEKLYRNIFFRIFEPRLKVCKVFPLGGKGSVLERCKTDDGSSGRLSLYVIDGDFSILGEVNHECDKLLTLSRYSIENYLLDSKAIVDLLIEEDLEKDRSELEEAFDYSGWVAANEDLLCDLFVVYSIAHKVKPELQTVQYKVNKLVANNRGEACEEKVKARIDELEIILKQEIGDEAYNAEKTSVMSLVEKCEGSALVKYVSGKDYLFPLVLMRMKTLVKIRAENKIIKQRLSLKCSLDSISESKVIKELTNSLSGTSSFASAQLSAP